MAGIDFFSSSVSSGCHTSTISTSLVAVPLCHTSCSKLSSNMNSFPSSHVLKRFQKISFNSKRHELIQQCIQTSYSHRPSQLCISPMTRMYAAVLLPWLYGCIALDPYLGCTEFKSPNFHQMKAHFMKLNGYHKTPLS
jgi:hypothetical protein